MQEIQVRSLVWEDLLNVKCENLLKVNGYPLQDSYLENPIDRLVGQPTG